MMKTLAAPALLALLVLLSFCTADARFTWAAPHAVGPALRRLLQLAPAGAPPTAFPAVQAPLAVPPPAPVAAAPQPMATASKNLLVVMTVMGEEAATIYRNQGELRSQLAQAAGVAPSQVLFYNQTANVDARTGVTAVSLIMNIECETPDACSRAGYALYSPTTQTRLTDNLARSSISLLPGTFQVYGVNSFNRYRGNETLWENKALTMQPPSAAAGAAGINYTDVIARSTVPVATATNGSAASGGLLGNFTIPGFTLDNSAAPTLAPSALNLSTLPGVVQPVATTTRSGAAAAAATSLLTVLPLLLASAALL